MENHTIFLLILSSPNLSILVNGLIEHPFGLCAAFSAQIKALFFAIGKAFINIIREASYQASTNVFTVLI